MTGGNRVLFCAKTQRTKPLEYKSRVKFIDGKLVGDKGYINKNFFQRFVGVAISIDLRLEKTKKRAARDFAP